MLLSVVLTSRKISFQSLLWKYSIWWILCWINSKLLRQKNYLFTSLWYKTKHSIKYSGHQISVFTSNLDMICLFHKPSEKVVNLLHFLKFHKEMRPILLRLSLCYKNVMKVCGSIDNVVGCICTRTWGINLIEFLLTKFPKWN